MLNDPQKATQKLSRVPLSLAVAVSETKGQGLPPGHPGASKDSTPRLLVFGDGTWVSNSMMGGADTADTHMDLFTSSLAWLRERPTIGEGATGRERTTFSLGVTDEQATRLVFLPGVLMLIGVVTLGGGVWVMRRR